MAAKQKKARRHQIAKQRGAEVLQLDAAAVRYWRLQRGFTQEALAGQRAVVDGQQQSISYAQIRRMEANGRCGPATARVLAELLGVDLVQLSPLDRRQLACGLPREPSTDFVGRTEEIKAVLGAFEQRGSVRIAASIEGLPGIGKTELALQICGLCERERRFRIFWFGAEQPDLRATWSDVVAGHLGVEAPESEQRAQGALRAIEAMAEPVLIVLDNVERWSASQPWPRPRGRHIRWLVTTRSRDLGGREFHHVDVPVLEAGAAEELMLRIAGPEIAGRLGFAPLMEALGGYTIAVELAAAFLRRFPEVDPAEYLESLRRGDSAEFEDEVEGQTLYGRTLQVALELLWARLPDCVRSSWQRAACFADAPVSAELSDACGLDRRARATLRDFHLIQAPSPRQWSMHRLVRAFGRRVGEEDHPGLAQRIFVRGCAERADAMTADTGFEIYSPDRAHFDAALRSAQASTEDSSQAELAWVLAAKIGSALCSLGELKTAETLLEEAIEREAETLGPEAPGVFELRRMLAWALYRSGESGRARPLLEQALEAALGRPPGSPWYSPEYTAGLQNDLAMVLLNLGDGERAKDLLEQALASDLHSLGEEHPRVALRRSNLALTLTELGQFAEAKALYERALDVYLSHFGERSAHTARTRLNLGGCLKMQGDLTAARAQLGAAAEIYAQLPGEANPDRLVLGVVLGGVLLDLDEVERAFELFRDTVESGQRFLGDGDVRVVRSWCGLAAVLHARGELRAAREILERALERASPGLREETHWVQSARSDLAWVLRDLKEPAQARVLLERALSSQERSGGGPDAVLTWRLAAVLYDLGEVDRARSLLDEASERTAKQPPVPRLRRELETVRDQIEREA